jgi:hypothetical protein
LVRTRRRFGPTGGPSSSSASAAPRSPCTETASVTIRESVCYTRQSVNDFLCFRFPVTQGQLVLRGEKSVVAERMRLKPFVPRTDREATGW